MFLAVTIAVAVIVEGLKCVFVASPLHQTDTLQLVAEAEEFKCLLPKCQSR